MLLRQYASGMSQPFRFKAKATVEDQLFESAFLVCLISPTHMFWRKIMKLCSNVQFKEALCRRHRWHLITKGYTYYYRLKCVWFRNQIFWWKYVSFPSVVGLSPYFALFNWKNICFFWQNFYSDWNDIKHW